MKIFALPVLLFLLISSSATWAQNGWSDHSRILPDKLRKVPTLLTISHSPNPNYPEMAIDPNIKSTYVWKHSTTICSPDRDLEVVEAGSFIWYSPSGWVENVQFTKRDFQKKFNCPRGMLEEGQCYSFEKNYRYGNDLYGGDALWYVIAKDEKGNLVKGFGIIETEGELQHD